MDDALQQGDGAGDLGDVLCIVSSTAPRLSCLQYRPDGWRPGGHILVSIHGVSRNAGEHLALLRQHADQYGVMLLAPTFAADTFKDYQRLGRQGYGPRADLALIRLLNEIGVQTGCDTSRVDLFGFSGGAQFVHRFAFAHPRRVRRVVLGAAGWYTMPDHALSYPHGIGDAKGLRTVRLNPAAAARLPTLIMVGELDDREDDEELNRSGVVCRTQGLSRLSRARAWTQAMNRFARKRGIPANFRFLQLPGVTHSFRQAVVEGQMGARLFEHCYAAGADADAAAADQGGRVFSDKGSLRADNSAGG